MGDVRPPFVGRQAELEELGEAVHAALEGRGTVWLVTGEAGIGKSRLLDELGERATAAGLTPLWGRCWEEGGAPAYWPWIQVLRAAFRRRERSLTLSPVHRQELATLLPELGEEPELVSRVPLAERAGRDTSEDAAARAIAGRRGPGSDFRAAVLAPEQARFHLLDAAVEVLCDTAEDRPLAIFLEDLHVADPSSILLLELLAAQARSSRLLVVGSLRDAPTEQRETVAPLLARVARDARVVALRRLEREEVSRFLEASCGRPAPGPAIDALHRTSEGHPLFLVETARWLLAHGDLDAVADDALLAVPNTLQAVLAERLRSFPTETRDALAGASVLGREAAVDDLAAVLEVPEAEVRTRLEGPVSAGVVAELLPGHYRFGHILFREVVYESLSERERRELHLRAADRWAAASSPVPAWPKIAHHLRRSGPDHAARALEAAVCAAESASDQLAFDAAVGWLEEALAILDADPGRSATRRCELLLALGRARLQAGDVGPGRATCRDAADLARQLGASALLARAALEYGGVFVFGEVDANLVELLEDALEALGPEDSSLRARCLARLASAQQPAPEPDVPIRRAREAIEMARRIRDDDTLLLTLQAACSALMDLGDPAEREHLNSEHAALARRLGRPLAELRGCIRLTFDRYELGDPAGAIRARTEAEALAERIDLPHYGWPVAALRALEAIRVGKLDEAEAGNAEAFELAREARDPNAPRSLHLQRILLDRWRGDDDAFTRHLAELRARFGGVEIMAVMASGLQASFHARAGRCGEARRAVEPGTLETLLRFGDLALLSLLSETFLCSGDTEAAARVYGRISHHRGRFESWGMLGMVAGLPVARSLALLEETLGRTEDADASFAEARGACLRTGAWAYAAWVAEEHGRALLQRPGGDRRRAKELLTATVDEAEALGLENLARRARHQLLAVPGGTRASAPHTPRAPNADAHRSGTTSRTEGSSAAFRLWRDGELWAIEHGGTTFRLKDTKGIRILAQLVEAPGREAHVLDLTSPTGRAHPDGPSDAGPVLDAEARAAYRARVATLRAELEEADTWNDLGRAGRAREELEAIEAELARAVGLGGRDRRAGAASERARVNVQRRLRDAIRRIGEHDGNLARHLDAYVRTGAFCAYEPPPGEPR